MTGTGAADTRDSFKRTADIAGLNEGGDGENRLKKTQREGQCAELSLCERV